MSIRGTRSFTLCLFLILIISVSTVSGESTPESDYCGVQQLYFQNSTGVSPEGYQELVNFPSGDPENDLMVAVSESDGPVYLGTYILPEGSLKDTTALLKGLRYYHTYHYVDSAVGITMVNFTAFRRFPNGTEVNFYSALTEDINALEATQYDTNYVSNTTLDLNPDDQLGIKVYAQSDHASPIEVHFVYEGSYNASYFQSGYFVCEEPGDITFIPAGDMQNNLPISLLLGLAGGIVAAMFLMKDR